MKPINRILQTLAIVATGWATLSLAACSEADTDPKVDLRYDTEDEYMVENVNPEAITIRVRSLYTPWEVKGTDESWYTITPSRGEAGETVTVTIQCKDNNELDDREDIISVVSDYWTGKQFRLFQKGSAYLEFDDSALVDENGAIFFEQEGDTYEIPVLFNQNWHAEITEGEAWMNITSGSSGKADNVASKTNMVVKADTNRGEQRPGVITLYDRYDRAMALVEVTQRGYTLIPIYPEDPMPNEGKVSWIRDIDSDAHTLTFDVESNAPWKVEKVAAEDDWFTIGRTSFQGNGTIELTMTANNGNKARAAEIRLVTEVDDPTAIPVEKIVKFKQANVQKPEVLRKDFTVNGNNIRITSGNGCGRYDFDVQGATGKELRFTMFFPNKPHTDGNARELRYWLNRAGTPNESAAIMSTMPWITNPFNPAACIDLSNSAAPGYYKLNKAERHTLTLDLSKVVVIDEETGEEQALANITWMVDGNVLASGANLSQNIGILRSDSGAWQMTYDEMNSPDSYVDAYGSFTLFEMRFTAPIDWGDAD